MAKVILASQSPARCRLLKNAGITPLRIVSDVDEEALLQKAEAEAERAGSSLPAASRVQILATAKAENVIRRVTQEKAADPRACHPRVVIGCDSMFYFNGEILGKPHTPAVARERLRAMSGKSGQLYTGHCVADLKTGKRAEGVSRASVYFADFTDREIDAYIATGEPLEVAGSFTLEGRGGPFIERTEGDCHGIIGLSLPLLRTLLAQIGILLTDLWD